MLSKKCTILLILLFILTLHEANAKRGQGKKKRSPAKVKKDHSRHSHGAHLGKVTTSYKGPCQQTVNGYNCAIPFIYKGVTYNACTSKDENSPWCATSVDRHGRYTGGGNYGWCNSDCGKESIGDDNDKDYPTPAPPPGSQMFTDFERELVSLRIRIQDKLINVEVPRVKQSGKYESGQIENTVIEKCQNFHSSCDSYKNYCESNSNVQRYCHKTCNLGACANICFDKRESSYCNAVNRQGACTQPKYQTYMERYCRLTCGMCDGKSKPNPINGSWGSWSSYGSCNSKCKKSRSRYCDSPVPKYGGGSCQGVTTSTQACVDHPNCRKKTVCTDKSSSCRNYKTSEYCQTYPKWMTDNCANTCSFCQAKSCGVSLARPQVDKESDTGRIVGGRPAQKGYYPWVVAIYYDKGRGFNFLCGGTLIDHRRVISAGHCYALRSKDPKKYKVTLGDHNRAKDEGTEQKLLLSKITVHEDYDYNYNDDDIAVLTLAKDAKFDKWVQPACLPKKDEEVPEKTECWVTGWGSRYVAAPRESILLEVQMPTASTDTCAKRNNNLRDVTITNKMLCAGNDDGSTFKSACQGDSGGGFFCPVKNKWQVQGIVSFGDISCNGLAKYTVFTKVSKYIDWLSDTKKFN